MKKFVIALAVAATATIAHAEEAAHAYFNVAGGPTHLNIDCTGATNCNKNGTGGKVLVGYRFSNGLGLEGGYATFGRARGSNATIGATVKPTAFLLGTLLSLPLSDEGAINVRLGAAQVKTVVNARVGTATGSASETKTKVYGGLGATYAISPSVKVELALDRTQSAFANEKASLSLISLGATYAF